LKQQKKNAEEHLRNHLLSQKKEITTGSVAWLYIAIVLGGSIVLLSCMVLLYKRKKAVITAVNKK